MTGIDIKLKSLTKYFVLTVVITLAFLMTDLVFSPETHSDVKESSKQKEFEKNWPRFRGPNGLGISFYTNIPTSWNGKTGEGILWKSEVPLPGENSPIIWGDRIFLAGADREKREVYCFDADSGDLLWRKSVDNISSESDYRQLRETSVLAASTSATDGKRIFTIFANGDIFCHDLEGNSLWSKCVGPIKNAYGHASSLLVYQDLLMVQIDQAFEDDGLSKILALRTSDGEMVWNTKRPVPSSWATPIVIDTGKREEIITCGNPWVIAYNPLTGKELWKTACLGGEVTLSPVYSDGLVYVANAMALCVAIRPGGPGGCYRNKCCLGFR